MLSLLLAASLVLAQDAPTRIRVGGNVQAANLIRKVTPVYPPLAKQARVQGTVRFIATVGREGDIIHLQLVSGHPLLVPSATAALQQWTYSPTLLNGQPVEVITQVDINYTLSEELAWAVNWAFLSQLRSVGGAQPEAGDWGRSARLLQDGSLQGPVSAGMTGSRFAPLLLDGVAIEPTVWFAKQQEGLPDVMAGWPQMELRILARREAVKPRADLEGKVVLDVIVNGEGNVESVLSGVGPAELVEEATRVVKDWKFRPVVINGSAFAVRTSIPFAF